MIFTRVLHDGLSAVINRANHKKIVFTRGEYHTTDPEECAYLAELGYKHDGDFPKKAKVEKPKKEEVKKEAPKKETPKAENKKAE